MARNPAWQEGPTMELAPARPHHDPLVDESRARVARTRGPAARGWLRIYLGYAPGAGTTCALLSEGRRRAELGTDVVVVDDFAHRNAPRVIRRGGGLDVHIGSCTPTAKGVPATAWWAT
jgi:hypothetical protein